MGWCLILKAYPSREACLWPNGLMLHTSFGRGPDDYFYVTVSQLRRSAVFNAGDETSQTPFLVLRFQALASSAIGR